MTLRSTAIERALRDGRCIVRGEAILGDPHDGAVAAGVDAALATLREQLPHEIAQRLAGFTAMDMDDWQWVEQHVEAALLAEREGDE